MAHNKSSTKSQYKSGVSNNGSKLKSSIHNSQSIQKSPSKNQGKTNESNLVINGYGNNNNQNKFKKPYAQSMAKSEIIP